uniref:MAK10-like protein n=1 Tax=Tanacetum cinerariifolium TaxID=118510 RepID=A0A6L2JEE8_TANCI|nr:MAK10-like protein [Tanacetum cinerariifolium]
MGDENPIRTLGDYFIPSHKGYMNTIKLPERNNVVPIRSDTIRLVQNGCSFHGLRSKDPNQYLKDFLKLVDSLDLDGRLRKISAKKAWATIEELARYEDEGWNDPITMGEGSLDYENPNTKQLLGVMECKVDTLIKESISLMGRSKSVFEMTSNTMYQLPSEPSRQEEFEDLAMNSILDQEERIKQLENYMQDIIDEFMEFSFEDTLRLKERIKENKSKP